MIDMKGNFLFICALFTTMSLTAGNDMPGSLILTPAASVSNTIYIDPPSEATGIPTSKEYLANLLDKFCMAYYYKCFKGREYADGSITIESVKSVSEWEVAVEGRHTYLGRLGHEYRKRPFRAVILMHKGTEDTFTITFEKQSENQLFNNTYWEDTTQIFRYKH